MEDRFVRDWTELANHHRSLGHLDNSGTINVFDLSLHPAFEALGLSGRIKKIESVISEEDSIKLYRESVPWYLVDNKLTEERIHGSKVDKYSKAPLHVY